MKIVSKYRFEIDVNIKLTGPIIFTSSLLLSSCSGVFSIIATNLYSGVDYGSKVEIYIPAEQRNISLKTGQEIEIKYQIANIYHAPNAVVRVATHDPSIIKVVSEKAGLIRGLSPGETTISFFYVKKRIDVQVKVEN